MNEQIVKKAVGCARHSIYRFRLGAVVYDKSNILGMGWNDAIKTHPKSPTPYKTRCAEFNAILDSVDGWGYRMLRGASIYVHRLRKDGSPGLAKPCRYCEVLITWSGIKNVEYSR